jgi:glutathione S-transferase
MIKIWGRKTSSNVQKAMWAVGELNLEHQRIDVGGAFGKNKEPAYLAMNPNGLVPTLEEEDGFLLWESNSVVRYLAGKHDKSGALEPKDPKQRAIASQWMEMLDAQLSRTQYVAGPSFSYGDIPVGIMCYRFVQLVPERPSMPNLDRWYELISKRKAFQDHVASVPLS